MVEYNYRRLPLEACKRSPPKVDPWLGAHTQHFTVNGLLCRAWKGIAEFSAPIDVMTKIPLVSKTAYMASRDIGVWS